MFVQRLSALTGAAKEQLAAALKSSTKPASVRSAFDLPPALQKAIDSAVKETFAVGTQIQFETVPELVSGIELSVNGQKVAWSIAEYLSTLEKSAADLLQEGNKPESKTDAKSPPDAEAEAKSALKQSAKPDPKAAAAKSDTNSATKLDTKVIAKPAGKPDSVQEPNHT